MKKATLTLLTLILVLCAGTSQATIRIFADGSGDYPDIQTALYAAAAGDTIELFNGVFSGPGNRNLEFEHNILLKSRYGYSECIIDCEGLGRGFVLTEETGGTIMDVTVRNGQAAQGAVAETGAGAYIFEDCLFMDNHATDRGGVWYGSDMGNVNFRYCIFSNNTAVNQGGVLMAENAVGVAIQFCTFVRNEAGEGAALYLGADAVADVQNTIIAFSHGGAAFDGYYFDSIDFHCSNLYRNSGGSWVNGATGLGSDGNISEDPMLHDPMAPIPDVRLTIDSPCRSTVTDCGEQMGAGRPSFSNNPRYGISVDGRGIFDDIQTAFTMTVLQDNAIVVLEDGVYPGSDNRNIQLSGISLESRSGDPESCIIDYLGAPDEYVLKSLHDTASVHVKGITIANTSQTNQEVLVVSGSAEVVIEDCIFKNNYSASATEHMFDFWWAENLEFRNCRFLDNTGDHELSMFKFGGGADTQVDFINCEFSGNQTGGTMVFVEDQIFRMDNTVFQNNQAQEMLIESKNNEISLEDVTIDTNTSENESLVKVWRGNFFFTGGSVSNNNSGDGTIEAERCDGRFDGVNFIGNTTGSHWQGGGVTLVMSDMNVLGCRFEDNVATHGAGGLYVGYPNASETIEVDFRVSGCSFVGNSSGSMGSGLTVDVDGSEYEPSGHYQAVALELESCTFDGNETGAFFDGQVNLKTAIPFNGSLPTGSLDATISNCLITNCAPGNGITAELNNDSSTQINCTNIHGNEDGDWDDPWLQDHFALLSNISENPLYCDPAVGDLTLQNNSPCLPQNNICNIQIGSYGEGCSGVSGIGGTPVGTTQTLITGNYPNPFNPCTIIRFELADTGPVSVLVYDMSGRLVRTLVQGAIMSGGGQEIFWDGSDDQGRQTSAGVYLARLVASGHEATHKMIMIK